MEKGPWYVQQQMLMVRKWSPDLKELEFDLTKLPVWVFFKKVPLELFTHKGLGYIASAVGIPKSMDRYTTERTRPEYARICVEIDVKKEVPQFIEVVRRDGSIAQMEVVIPRIPVRYANCSIYGHSSKCCTNKSFKGGQ